MARTRAQEAGISPSKSSAKAKVQKGTKRKASTIGSDKPSKQAKAGKGTGSAKAEDEGSPQSPANLTTKVQSLLERFGNPPLSSMSLREPDKPTAATVLAHILNAMLTSARISHELAAKSVKCLIEAGYHDLETLQKSSWQERTEVLTKGGYTRYREKTATGLGELAEFVSEKYSGDLNNLRKEANDDPDQIRSHVKEIKGLGDVGINIFCDTIQGLWPCLAPFIDPRSEKTAEQIGLGTDVEKIYEAVEKHPQKMAELAVALTTVRLEKKEKEFAS
ncbi:MAG: hypothetical protein M1820_000639 [Bogoriella megaspora]|nr:MAG: hypothetical protein M1820_000639 [Bogoriella megaspora]